MDGCNESANAKWLNARRVYMQYGIPRSLLRELAASGKVRTREVRLPESGKTMKLYNYGDCEAVVG